MHKYMDTSVCCLEKVLRYSTKAQSESNTLISDPIITNWNKEMDI